MARGVTSQARQGPVEKLLPKKRIRTKVPLKPKNVLALLASTEGIHQHRAPVSPLQAIVRCWTNVPRAIRARIERARNPRVSRVGTSNALKVDPAANQPLVRSNSGKVALGPWSGPFRTNDSGGEENPVLYMDRLGSCHHSLDAAYDQALIENEVAHTASPTHNRTAVLMPATPESQKAHSQEMAVLQRKPETKWMGKGVSRSARKSQASRRVGVINQPRRMN